MKMGGNCFSVRKGLLLVLFILSSLFVASLLFNG